MECWRLTPTEQQSLDWAYARAILQLPIFDRTLHPALPEDYKFTLPMVRPAAKPSHPGWPIRRRTDGE